MMFSSTFILAAALAAQQTAPAQTQQTQPAQQAQANQPQSITLAQYDANIRQIFQQTDSNNDGRVDAGEVAARALAATRQRGEAMFDRMDANDDEMISKAEFMANLRQPATARTEQNPWIRARDADNDGTVTLNEAVQRARAMFSSRDANNDGILTASELRAPARRAPAAQQPQGR
ncbi:MAG: EF-hand domain-containing protein [Sphingomonadaceae bacterium]